MNKVELLAPAGNLFKAKIALDYGADAVYVGGKLFSLRARASNFSLDEIHELCLYAKERNKKVYVTTNIIPHDSDLEGLSDYLIKLEKIGVDAIITSSLYIIKTAEKVAPKLERHVSTQMSIANSKAISFYESLNVNRVVLARETTLAKMQEMRKNTKIAIEVFIHGGMCSSYSGRCVLSNHFTKRDANRGGCAHSCRWNYDLYNNEDKINQNGYFNFGSKDLVAVDYISELLKMGVNSLKIEGRMKSSYYLACVIKSYRRLIDLYYENKLDDEKKNYYFKEILKAENRSLGIGFYKGIATKEEGVYDNRTEIPTQNYLGRVLSYNKETKEALIEERNYFEKGSLIEIFGPDLDNYQMTVESIRDYETGLELDVARHPLQMLYIKCDKELKENDMLRLVSVNEN